MEFPHLGKHCNEATCNKLDFLPFKCDSCDKVFCSTHFHYEQHACKGERKNVQVPVCPLCGQPVPTPPGVEPDLTVGQHIDQQCKSEKKKIFTNRCSYKGCKRKELIPVTCTECRQNFCLRHRHTSDHECKKQPVGAAAAMGNRDQRSLAANAAEQRRANKNTSFFNMISKSTNSASTDSSTTTRRPATSIQVQNIQGNMTEDEALAHALALSIYEQDEAAAANRNRNDETTAQRGTTLSVGGNGNQQSSGKEKCSLS